MVVLVTAQGPTWQGNTGTEMSQFSYCDSEPFSSSV